MMNAEKQNVPEHGTRTTVLAKKGTSVDTRLKALRFLRNTNKRWSRKNMVLVTKENKHSYSHDIP